MRRGVGSELAAPMVVHDAGKDSGRGRLRVRRVVLQGDEGLGRRSRRRPARVAPVPTRVLLCALMAEDESGHLKHRQALIGLARKNGKTALGTSLALSTLVCGPIGAEVYSCAGDRDQARIVFGTAKAMVELDPELSAVCKVYRDPDRGRGHAERLSGPVPPTHHGRKGSARRS